MKLERIILLLMLMLALTSCDSHSPFHAAPPDSPVVAKLRTEAHNQGRKWKVVCFSDDGKMRYMGWMVYADQPFKNFIEEGATRPMWVFTDLPTQDAAAQVLLDNMARPNTEPEHRSSFSGPEVCDVLEGN